jgi:hypothetical protein
MKHNPLINSSWKRHSVPPSPWGDGRRDLSNLLTLKSPNGAQKSKKSTFLIKMAPKKRFLEAFCFQKCCKKRFLEAFLSIKISKMRLKSVHWPFFGAFWPNMAKKVDFYEKWAAAFL